MDQLGEFELNSSGSGLGIDSRNACTVHTLFVKGIDGWGGGLYGLARGTGMLPAQKIPTQNPPTHTAAQVLDPAIAADGARMDGGWGVVGETLLDVTVGCCA